MAVRRFPESRSQAFQDLFVLAATEKRNGFFLEIGGFHSENLSNTFLLERRFEWQGVTVEFLAENAAEIASHRTSTVICEDATTIKWSVKMPELGIPREVDYLQVDCEPALSSLISLWRVLVSGIRPRVITFEHDAYANSTLVGVLPQGRWVRWWSRILLRSLGYTLVAGNVGTKSGKPFEDWWVRGSHPRLKRATRVAVTDPHRFMSESGLFSAYERLAKTPSGKD